MTDDLAIVSTAIDPTSAEALATDLVDRRLAACAQVTAPMTSTYRWQGNVERATEVLVVCKTTAAAAAALVDEIAARHPYDVPEIVVTPVLHSNAAYRAWVNDNVEFEGA
jgi:periplasmic divalent cation tolerance protein